MAAEGSSANPIIVEPSTSPNSTNPPSLSTNSSSNSLESSRPQSQCTSATSRSETSDSNIELRHVPKSAPPPPQTPLASLSQSSTLVSSNTTSTAPSSRDGTVPGSVPHEQTLESGTSNRFSKVLSLIPSRLSGHWLLDLTGITVAVISLAASLASLIWLGMRTYKLSVSSAVNGAVSACAGLIQANLATLETITPKCKGILAQGATPSPYQLGKRALHTSLTAGSRLLERRRYTQICTVPSGGCEHVEISVFDLNSGAILVCAVLVLGGLLLVFARRKSRIGGVFHSPARSDVQVTRHNQQGTETITGQSVKIIKQNPEDYQYAGQLRQRIRNVPNQNESDSKDDAAWQPYSSSTDTLVNPWTGPNPSKVSITNGSADEKHEGLIELETTGGNKAFFDPETGEFVHLTPWKSTHSDGEESDDDHSLKADDKGSVKSALAHMATGGAAWAGGKEVDDMLKMKIREADKRIEKVEIPQRAGDSLAGQVTNERLSGWPQTV